jgi:4-hydroxy-3-methylbut-2-enyl diphosphate reductase
MVIEIDNKSGFCFGVQNAIAKVEELLSSGESVNCLGEIVHNHEEVERLSQLGMATLNKEEGEMIKDSTVLLRTHGEPPSTYRLLEKSNNKIVDATCPVVLKLQQRIKKSFDSMEQTKGQLVVFGKKGHAEVIGLNGQTGNKAIVVNTVADLELIDFTKPIELYSQTTMPLDAFHEISKEIKQRAQTEHVTLHDTVCRQVANRVPNLKQFAKKYDAIVFVSGKNSSNGKLLFDVCKNENPRSYFISQPNEVHVSWLTNITSVGICGATSTPIWLMENVKEHIKAILNI